MRFHWFYLMPSRSAYEDHWYPALYMTKEVTV
jgi:hypothetical protein